MKKKARHLIELLFGSILSLLGFSGCEIIGLGREEYGQPHADFKVLGEVTDVNGKPIKGIRVVSQRHWHLNNRPGVIYDENDGYLPKDTLYTDENGKFEKAYGSWDTVIVPMDVGFVIEDIDEEENGGNFVKQEIVGEVKQTKKGDGHWYDGAYESEISVKMEKSDK